MATKKAKLKVQAKVLPKVQVTASPKVPPMVLAMVSLMAQQKVPVMADVLGGATDVLMVEVLG